MRNYGTTQLAPLFRGDTFLYSFTLAGDWVAADFTGGLKMTFRTEIPDGADDSDALYQASVSGGQIVTSGASGTITIPASVTSGWPARRLLWDLQGVIDSGEDIVHTIDAGTLLVIADITRSVA